MSRHIPEHPEKGSPEAYAWAEKMRAARQKKKRLAHTIREAGRRVEQEFFGPGGPLEVKALKRHTLNPKKDRYNIVCGTGGCVFLREGLSKTEANRQAVSHLNQTGHHNISIVRKNPGAKWHQGEEDVAFRYKKQAKDQLEKAFFAGVEAAHQTSGSAARKLGMNPIGPYEEIRISYTEAKHVADLIGRALPKEQKTVMYIPPKGSQELPFSLTKRKGKYYRIIQKETPSFQKNPIAVFNPPAQAGVIYNNAVEIRAQKTGGPLKGHYKHMFDPKKVRIIGLTDGTVLLQHKDGKPLWITRKDYERSGRKH
jgi:hypothetical protein